MPTNATSGSAPAASITKEYLKGALNYATEMPTNATPASAALHRLHTCLSAANLTGYFQSRGLLVAAERDAESLFNVLGRIIPKELGSGGLKSHCWKEETEFRVVRQNGGRTMKRLTADNKAIRQAKLSIPFLAIKGHIGSLPITFHPSKYYWNDDQYDFMLELLNLLDNYSSSITCAPRVFLAGFTKCGTTFLYNMITSHPLMVKPDRKEPKWWHTVPVTNSHPNLTALFVMRYFMHFESLAKTVLYDSPNALTIDATPGTMYKWPGVSKEITNFCLLPTVIPEILPKSKFIIMMLFLGRNIKFWIYHPHRLPDGSTSQSIICTASSLTDGYRSFWKTQYKLSYVFVSTAAFLCFYRCVLFCTHRFLAISRMRTGYISRLWPYI